MTIDIDWYNHPAIGLVMQVRVRVRSRVRVMWVRVRVRVRAIGLVMQIGATGF